MIGKIKGIVDSIQEGEVIVDVNGVGYVLHCTTSTISNLSAGMKVDFYTHLLVKEDQLTLFGFENATDKKWFNILQTVQGVGPRMALSILSSLTTQDIYNSLLSEDSTSFKSISGIGPKLASRIVNELKNKKGLLDQNQIFFSNKSNNSSSDSSLHDVISALTNLGFARKDIFPIASEILKDNEGISVEEAIKLTLTKLTS